MFCFCAFTSLRYSDMANLKRTDIAGDTMYITTQKTHDRLPINLNSFAKEILAKYEDQRFPGGTALPDISNQKMNDYLKSLCELCEFNAPITTVTYRAGKRVETTKPKYELIGTHAGRRTFICFALASGIPPQVVMKWTGHSICRNRILQKMFIVFGRGERLGSGADIISQGWKENNWPDPEIHEHFGANTDRVELTLRLGTVSVQNPESKERGKETSKEKIKALMREDKFITIGLMAQRLRMSESGVEKAIRILRKNGEINRKGGRFGGEWEVIK